MAKNICFVSWDSPETNYLQNLFLPIFYGLNKKYGYNFTIIQFSWANQEIINQRKIATESLGFNYYNLQVSLSPVAFLGKFSSVFKHIKTVNDILIKHQIQIVMPRSIMPALATFFIKNADIKICYDADGLPILERLESKLYKSTDLSTLIFRYIERKIVTSADKIITRSEFASNYLEKKYNTINSKVSVVVNGKDASKYFFDNQLRKTFRSNLQVDDSTILFVYCGSLGPKYRLEEMVDFFLKFNKIHLNSKFIILTPDSTNIDIKNTNILKFKASALEVIGYLNAADIGLGFITETTSMKAASAIKYSEYALCGLPSLISDVGDVLKHTQKLPFLKHYNADKNFEEYENFILKSISIDRNHFSHISQKFFSLDLAVNTYHKALCNI